MADDVDLSHTYIPLSVLISATAALAEAEGEVAVAVLLPEAACPDWGMLR